MVATVMTKLLPKPKTPKAKQPMIPSIQMVWSEKYQCNLTEKDALGFKYGWIVDSGSEKDLKSDNVTDFELIEERQDFLYLSPYIGYTKTLVDNPSGGELANAKTIKPKDFICNRIPEPEVTEIVPIDTYFKFRE